MAKQILRAHWHDYKDTGYYMITMVTEARVRAFGTLVGNSEESANVELSPLGKVLEKEIKDQSKRHPEIKIEDYIILEDHCHILVHVHTTMPDHLGKVVWGIKYGTYSSRCAFLAPWHDRPKGERAAKPDCELMNEICAILQSEISQNSTCLSK